MNLLNAFDCFKRVCFLALLMTFSTNMQAQSLQASTSGTEAAPANSAAANGPQNAHYFPRWPERRHEKIERLPPPPPGPYMSSAFALDGSADSNSPFSRDQSPAKLSTRSSVSKSTFGPDTPWPSNSPSPHRWKPESGYHYVPPQVNNQVYPAIPSNYQYGYRYPVMSRSAPVTQRVPVSGGQYNNANRYQRQAGSNTVMQQRQADGNIVMQQRQAANNMIYPVNSKP